MRRTNGDIACVLVFLLLAPDFAIAQNPSQQWTVLERLSATDKLVVELKGGQRVKGTFSVVSDTSLTVSDESKTRDVSRGEIRRIYRVRGKSVGNAVLRGTAIGGAVGASLGAAIRGGCILGPCPNRAERILRSAVLMAIPGAVAGLIVGSIRQNRELIYVGP